MVSAWMVTVSSTSRRVPLPPPDRKQVADSHTSVGVEFVDCVFFNNSVEREPPQPPPPPNAPPIDLEATDGLDLSTDSAQ
eukprot:98231-Chlamydomonas_euryale.AAC.1